MAEASAALFLLPSIAFAARVTLLSRLRPAAVRSQARR